MVKTQSFGQILVLNGDTVSCYTNSELNEITKASEKLIKLTSDLNDCEQKIVFYKKVVLDAEIESEKNIAIIKNFEEMIELDEYQLEKYRQSIKQKDREIRRQKLFKFVGTSTGISTTILMTILFIRK